jgi:hypothetical protein
MCECEGNAAHYFNHCYTCRRDLREANMKKIAAIISFTLWLAASAAAQDIRVSPSSVNAYSQGATTVFLTFTNVVNKRPADACFCGELIPAAPDIGFKCAPGSEFGCLPVRYDQSRLSGNATYTDIMSVPPSVSRRAYLDAAGGAEATFFYVRRFVSTVGGPDEFVPVTLRLSGNGAATPFSITQVKLSWGVDKPVLIVKPDEKLPSIKAEINYTGTGRLVGRWEIVKPGEALPSERDLLTEATLPVEERGLQRRYTQLSRFNIFLPPVGRFTLPGPEWWRVPSHINGLYLVLLRIEAAEDANPSLAAAGQSALASGGVAGFSMPVLRYYVGGGSGLAPVVEAKGMLALVEPVDKAVLTEQDVVDFRWTPIEGAAFYRLEIDTEQAPAIFSAIVLGGLNTYRAPSWLRDKVGNVTVRWRVLAFDQSRNQIGETLSRSLRFKANP